MLALWQAVYTAVHKTLAGRLLFLGLSRWNRFEPPETRRQEACVWSGLKVAGMGNPTLCFFPRSLGQVTTLSNPFLIPALVPLASLVSESPDVGRRAIDTSPAGLMS